MSSARASRASARASTPGKADPEEVAKLIRNAQDKLIKWAQCPAQGAYFCGIPNPMSPFFKALFGPGGLGGYEGASTMLKVASLDTDGDGTVDANELDAFDGIGQEVVGNVLGFLTNAGVVAALLLSIVYPLMIQFPPAKDGSATFNPDVLRAFEIGFFVSTYAANALCAMTLYLSARMYMHLGFWMPNTEEQIWYIQYCGSTFAILAAFQFIAIAFFGVAAIFSALVSTGWYGMMGLSVVVALIPGILWDILVIMPKTGLRQHALARRILIPRLGNIQDANEGKEGAKDAIMKKGVITRDV